jgi:multidrug transporter EmrE-like cation transporter
MNIIMNYLPFLILLAGGSILTLGDIVMKKWIQAGHAGWYLLGLGVYLIGLNFLAQSFRYKNMAVASTIFVVCNVITLSLISWFYFKETLSPLQLVGIVLGLSSIFFLEMA